MYIAKEEIIAVLRSRGRCDRADWVERELPHLVDIHKNSSLLQMLDIDPATMPSVDPQQHDATPPRQGIRHERSARR